VSALPSAVLFDLDGTLIDTYRLYLECYRRAMEPYLGRRLGEDEILSWRPTSERGFLVHWVGEAHAEACHVAAREHYEALHRALGEGPYEGVREMLAALRSAGYPLGIVTGKGRHAWEVTERDLALGPFGVVVTDDDVAAPKPDPQGLLAASRAIDVLPAEIVYVGDSEGDLRAGRAAGMRTAAALWPKTGPGERERFVKEVEPLAPDWLLDHPADLTRLLARWC
jgi:pyrophosphatase PpaX